AEISYNNEDATFGSVDATFANGLDGLEKNTSSFFQESGKSSASLLKTSDSGDNNANGGARDYNPAEDSNLKFNVSRLLNNDSINDTEELSGNSRRVSDANETRLFQNNSNNNKRENLRWSAGAPSTRNTKMTLKEQERVIDEIKKENFSLKMKVYFLEEQLSKLGPDEMDKALKEEEEDYKQALFKIEQLEQENANLQRRYMECVAELKRQRELVKPQKINNDIENSQVENLRAELTKEREERNVLYRQLQDTTTQLEKYNNRDDELDDEFVSELIEERAQQLAEKFRQEEAEKYNTFMQQLKTQNATLKAQLSERDNDVDELYAELEMIRGRPKSATTSLGEISSRLINGDFNDQFEESLGHLRDKVAELTLELREKTMQIDQLITGMEEINATHASEIRELEDNWDREAGQLKDEIIVLRESLGIVQNENEQLIHDLTLIHNNRQEEEDSYENLKIQLQEKVQEISDLKQTLDNVDAEIFEKSRENQNLMDKLNKTKSESLETIEELQKQIRSLKRNSESQEKLHDESVSELKEKLATHKTQLSELQVSQETSAKEIAYLHREIENYKAQIVDLENRVRVEAEQRNVATSKEQQNLEKELEKVRKEKREAEKNHEKTLNELEEKLQKISELEITVQERDDDLHYARQQLGNQTNRSKDTLERYTKEQERLRVELDAMRQEFEKTNSRLETVSDELESKKIIILQYEDEVKRLNNQKSKLNEKLTGSEAARIKAEEMCRNVQMDMRDKDSTIDELKSQVTHLESNLSQEKKSTFSHETQYRDQIIERNTLLITTYQYLDTIMSDGTKQPNFPKPSTNFNLFHEHLLSKLKTLNHVHTTFERRAKEIDTRWQEQYEQVSIPFEQTLKKQMDIKLRQMSKFDSVINKANAATKEWREQAKKNQGELEATRNTNEELLDQLASLRDQLEDLRSVKTRADEYEVKYREAERRARNLDTNMRDDERRWESRYKELEGRMIQAEERLQIEKQGARVKVDSMRESNKDLEAQIQSLNRRNAQLQELLDFQKTQMEVSNETKAFTYKAENTLALFNEQLRAQLEEKNKALDNERERLKALEDQCAKFAEQIERRDLNITKVLTSLQQLNQRKDFIENAVFRQISEEMQSTLTHEGEGSRRSSYQPPPYINPPWKPPGNTTGSSKKSIVTKPSSSTLSSIKTSIPTLSSITRAKKTSEGGASSSLSSNLKSAIPTRLPSLNTNISNSNSPSSASSIGRGFIPKPFTKDAK
ncbi:1197_t:CDS:10, partial [Ambispora leptoticha]